MNWPTILALAVFVGMCGFIAYWGDLLGRRMGKRRLSLFGLRPRYTAILTTTITGMLIAVLTIATMMAGSEHVRTLVLRGGQILSEQKKILRRYEAVRKSYGMATKELGNQRRIAEKARLDAREAVVQRDMLAAEISRLTKEIAEQKAVLRRNEAALAEARGKLESARTDLAGAREEVAKRREEIREQKKRIADLEARRARLARLYVEDMKAVGQKYWPLRDKEIVFRANQEIARRAIRCAQSKLEIKSEVLALLKEADEQARLEGAKVGDNGRAVEIFPKKIVGPEKEQFLKEAASIDAVVDQISGGLGSVVARVVSVGNSVEDEQVLVEILLNYNRLVYLKDQEIADVAIDGRAPRGQILGGLIHFLRSEVRFAATNKGVIPSYDDDGQPSVGQIDWDSLLDMVDRIKAEGRPVRVKATAADETWSAGPLNLKLIVGDSP